MFQTPPHPEVDYSLLATTPQPKVQWDHSRTMLANQWQSSRNSKVLEHPVPKISHPQDAIVYITTNTICGSDLHLWLYDFPQSGLMKKGDIMGHEGVGIVAEVGPECKNFKPGDRVVVSAVIACGQCEWCKRGQFSLCDRTNQSKMCEDMFGYRLAGIFGYSWLVGGYSGMQAEVLRVPLADNTLLKLPDSVKDEQAIFLSDVFCTAWHGNELGEVHEGSTVAIWGCGPVGLSTAYLARYRGATRVISIDCVEQRLALASQYANADIINFDKTNDVVAEIKKLLPNGPDVCIECAGYRYAKSTSQKLWHSTLGIEQSDNANEMYRAVKKGGHVVWIGDYFGFANHFPTGCLMEKGVTTRGSQVYVQKYWQTLLKKIENKEIDPSWLVNKTGNFEDIPELYRQFNDDKGSVIKLALRTAFGRQQLAAKGAPQSQTVPQGQEGKSFLSKIGETAQEPAERLKQGAGQGGAEQQAKPFSAWGEERRVPWGTPQKIEPSGQGQQYGQYGQGQIQGGQQPSGYQPQKLQPGSGWLGQGLQGQQQQQQQGATGGRI